MKYLVLLLTLIACGIFAACGVLTACGDNHEPVEVSAVRFDAGPSFDAAPTQTQIFYACEEEKECETGYCANLDYNFDAGPTVCSEVCQTQEDCKALHINAICLCDKTPEHYCSRGDPNRPDTPGHCVLPCWPEELPDVCDYYGLFCPSDCLSQGLVCTLTTWRPWYYTCQPPPPPPM